MEIDRVNEYKSGNQRIKEAAQRYFDFVQEAWDLGLYLTDDQYETVLLNCGINSGIFEGEIKVKRYVELTNEINKLTAERDSL